MRDVPYEADTLDMLHQRAVGGVEPFSSNSLLDALENLPVRDRRVLEALLWELASPAALARELGVSRPHVYYLRNRALRLLKDELCNANGLPTDGTVKPSLSGDIATTTRA